MNLRINVYEIVKLYVFCVSVVVVFGEVIILVILKLCWNSLLKFWSVFVIVEVLILNIKKLISVFEEFVNILIVDFFWRINFIYVIMLSKIVGVFSKLIINFINIFFYYFKFIFFLK